MRIHPTLSFVAIFILCAFLSSVRIVAATVTVNTSADLHDVVPGDGICGDPMASDSTCSLRAALEEANANAESDSILVPASLSPFRLTRGELVISDSATVLRGVGGVAIVDGAGQPIKTNLLEIRSSGNRIEGMTFRRARVHGVLVLGAHNTIGGTAQNSQVTVVGAGIDDDAACGILLQGEAAFDNAIEGCFVGLLSSGGIVIPNPHGIGISNGAHDNRIGGISTGSRNVISGNTGDGILLEQGAHHNQILGNLIGPDQSGVDGPGNGGNGIGVSDGAVDNLIGGTAFVARNYICGNRGDGIALSGPGTEQNRIIGNSIGIDVTGYVPFANRGNGISLSDGATGNEIGSNDSGVVNIISGNLGHGISVTGAGSDANRIRGNLIGFDSSGYGPVGNGEFFAAGVYLGEGVNGTIIGGTSESERNYFAYNLLGGIYLDGADETVIQGNYIGVSLYSLSAGYNGNGIVLQNGASGNLIGGALAAEANVISGNLMDEFPFGAGVLMIGAGTRDNRVLGNRIGVDASGSRRIPNASAGVVICEGASNNMIGGSQPGEGNIISGNGYATNLVSIGRGVHLYGDGTSRNIVTGNLIGVGADSLAAIPNLGNGVGIYFGASDNWIGGDLNNDGNIIAENRCHGIYFQASDTRGNRVAHNRIWGNDSLGIAVRQSAQGGIEPPMLVAYLMGQLSGTSSPLAQIDIYLAEDGASPTGEGRLWIGRTVADGNGDFAVTLPSQDAGARVTAIATDVQGNSSEFAHTFPLDLTTEADENEHPGPVRFQLAQNFPNPFNPSTSIGFTLPHAGPATLMVYNLLGERVVTLANQEFSAGEHTVIWDGRSEGGEPVSSGVYWYRLVHSGTMASKKMLLIK